jgi:hypothetical protein
MDTVANKLVESNKRRAIHGAYLDGKREKLYSVWSNLIGRCTNPNNPQYKGYGGRGISVCKSWRYSYTNFRCWSHQNGYSDSLLLDRIDNDGNYEPGNCRFTDRVTSSRNTRRTKWVEAFGERKCIEDWSRDSRCAVTAAGLRSRLLRMVDPETAITRPPQRGKQWLP